MPPKKTASATAPETFASGDFATYGQGLIVVVRETGANADTATFVVDALATGVRRATRSVMTAKAFRSRVLPALNAEHGVKPVAPEVALAILIGAADFAKASGFATPAGYAESATLFQGVIAGDAGFRFGKAGKPHFRPMHGDSAEFVEIALAKLTKSRGATGFTQDLDEFEEDMIDGEDSDEPAEDRE